MFRVVSDICGHAAGAAVGMRGTPGKILLQIANVKVLVLLA